MNSLCNICQFKIKNFCSMEDEFWFKKIEIVDINDMVDVESYCKFYEPKDMEYKIKEMIKSGEINLGER